MYYLIKESLTPCGPEDIRNAAVQFVAVLTGEEWRERRDSFDMVIDMDMDTVHPTDTKAVVNLDSLTGILSRIATILADEKIGIFAVSTFDTDYILVKAENLHRAAAALKEKGYGIDG